MFIFTDLFVKGKQINEEKLDRDLGLEKKRELFVWDISRKTISFKKLWENQFQSKSKYSLTCERLASCILCVCVRLPFLAGKIQAKRRDA